MQFKTIGIQLTNSCNSRCRLCCFSSDHSKKDFLSLNLIEKIISEASAIPIKTIGFTGGEPFIDFDYLTEAIQIAGKYQLNSIITTNGSWASNTDSAKERLRTLKHHGLNGISFSYDEFHEEYIPYKILKNAITICKELKIPCELGMCFRQRGKKASYFMDLFGETLFNIPIIFQTMLPVGRALDCYDEDDFFNLYNGDGMRCPNLHTKLAYVDIYGDFYPCCSQFASSTLLSAGNIKSYSISALLDKQNKNMYFRILEQKGFDFYINALTSLHIPVKAKWTSPCELCMKIFSDLNIIEQLQPIVHDEIHKQLIEREIHENKI